MDDEPNPNYYNSRNKEGGFYHVTSPSKKIAVFEYRIKKALEFINSFGHLDDIDWEAEDPLEFARGIKNILDPQRKTKAFGFD